MTVDVRALVASETTLLQSAEVCRNPGRLPLSECAPVLYLEYPSTSAVDLATVFAAVWSECATVAGLVDALTLCQNGDGTPAYDEATIGTAAKLASMNPHTVFMRDGLGDDGTIPYSGPFQSPDIVPNPVDPSALATQWNADLGTNIVTTPGMNRIYTRLFNAYPTTQDADVYLYWSLPSMLMTPSQWVGNVILNENDTDHVTVAAIPSGTGAVAPTPFLWAPDVPDEDHYCLISRVVTAMQPDDVPSDDSLETFVEWVRDHPGVAWRNTTTVPIKPGTQLNLTVSFGNPTTDALDYLLAVDCTNLPVGTTVTVRCDEPGPDPAIATTATISRYPLQTVLVPTLLPGMFRGILVITVLPPGDATLSDDMVVAPRNMIQDPPNGLLAQRSLPASSFGISAETAAEAGISADSPLLYLGDYLFVLVPG